MDNLQIRITLTNGKGWRETKTISLEQYEREKLVGNNIFDKTLDELVELSENASKNRKLLDNIILNWRP